MLVSIQLGLVCFLEVGVCEYPGPAVLRFYLIRVFPLCKWVFVKLAKDLHFLLAIGSVY